MNIGKALLVFDLTKYVLSFAHENARSVRFNEENISVFRIALEDWRGLSLT